MPETRLLFNTLKFNNHFADLCINDFTNVYIQKKNNGIFNITIYSIIIINILNIFFTNTILLLLNNIKKKIALLFRKLKSKEILAEVNKALG